MNFKLEAPFSPMGDQPKAIEEIVDGFNKGLKDQVLLGVTGSGKTFTMANIIQNIGKPTLIMSHNKTLAAQLYMELKDFFPNNPVEYFISYYDYYQPEAYIPSSDTYIEKSTSLNEQIEKMRLKATSSLVSRRDVIVVSSVSCIYGLGSPYDYVEMSVNIKSGENIDRKEFFKSLVEMQYTRNKYDLNSGTFRVNGDIIDIMPAYDTTGIRLETFGNEIERISVIDYLTGEIKEEKEFVTIFPSKHFVVSKPKIETALKLIEEELEMQVEHFKRRGKLLEAQRIEQRTRLDIEFLKEMGFCSGIENYSRFLTGREAGERPYCLMDFFPKDFLMVIDESHVTVPQIRGMYNGDRARKSSLVEYGFRLPSALDNRPLQFHEFESIDKQILYLSATPAEYELKKSGGAIAEQVIRPTGILDPEIIVKPVKNQIDDLMEEIKVITEREERVLVTTLTKKMSEDLTTYLVNHGVRAKYLHSEIDSVERIEILRDLRVGKFDVLVGINLLREGLDLPEVSLVAILDADREGFLRDKRSLLQTSGRAARNVKSKVIFYAEKMTDSMKGCIEETERRRKIQQEYNEKHGITPKTVYKSKEEILEKIAIGGNKVKDEIKNKLADFRKENSEDKIKELTVLMQEAAKELKFEFAAEIRDKISDLKNMLKK